MPDRWKSYFSREKTFITLRRIKDPEIMLNVLKSNMISFHISFYLSRQMDKS